MAVGVLQYLVVRNFPRNAVSFFVHHHRRNAHHKTAIPLDRLQLLDGVAGGAGEAVLVHLPINLGVFGQTAGHHGDGVVATVTMARKLNALGIDQNIHARPVKGRAEGIGVESLTPLAVGLLMAMGAISGIWKCARLDEVVALHLHSPGNEEIILAEAEVIGPAYLVGVLLAILIGFVFRGLIVSC